MTDAFTLATQPAVVDYPRDRYGRPLVIPPDGGRPVPYGRPSSWGKKIEDTYGLEMWQRRMVVVGMSRTPSLVARACAITADPKAWTAEDKKQINAIADEAQTAAKSNQAADIGTALHRMTERVDLGETLSDLPEPFKSDIAAYTAGMVAHGLLTTPKYVECRMVCDELKLAGTADRVVAHAIAIQRIFDLKTGDSIEAAALGYAVQLAIYAHSVLYDIPTGQRTPLDLDTSVAYIGHLPAGQARFDLYEVDIAAGWEAALLAADIDQWRKRKGLLKIVVGGASAGDGEGSAEQGSTPPPATPSPVDQRNAVATNPDEGGPADAGAFMALEQQYMALPDDARKWLAEFARDATQAGVSFHAKEHKTVRRFELLRALVQLSQSDSVDDDTLRAVLATVIGDVAHFPAVTVGHLIGSLSAGEAEIFARRVDELVTSVVPCSVSPDGVVTLEFSDLAA